MENQNYALEFKSKGYVKIPLLTQNEVIEVRKTLAEIIGFPKKVNGCYFLLPSKILSHPEIFSLMFRKKIISSLKKIFGPQVSYIPDFTLHWNQYNQRNKGWHTDSQSERLCNYL